MYLCSFHIACTESVSIKFDIRKNVFKLYRFINNFYSTEFDDKFHRLHSKKKTIYASLYSVLIFIVETTAGRNRSEASIHPRPTSLVVPNSRH